MQKLICIFLFPACLLAASPSGSAYAAQDTDEVLVPRKPGSGWTTAPPTDEVLVPGKQTLGQDAQAANEVLVPKNKNAGRNAAAPLEPDQESDAYIPHIVVRSDQNCNMDADCGVTYNGCSLCGVENGSWEAINKGASGKYSMYWRCTAEEKKRATPECKYPIDHVPATAVCRAHQCVMLSPSVSPK